MTEPEPTRTPMKLEDLLRLKRAERPAEDFWNDFERELRAKQLSAIVKKESAWKTWFLALPKWGRLGLPAATAAASLGLVLWTTRAPQTTPGAITQETPAPAMAENTFAREPLDRAPGDNLSPAPVMARAEAKPALVAAQNLMPNVSLVALIDQPTAAEQEILIDLTRELAAALPPPLSGETLSVTDNKLQTLAKPALETILDLPAEQSPRKERLIALASYETGRKDARGSTSSGSFSRERLTRRLTSDALIESFSRLDMSGDRVLIKF